MGVYVLLSLPKSVYIVSHEEDIDGIGAAAIAVRGTGSRRVYLVGYRAEGWEALAKIFRSGCRSESSAEILISDLNPGKRHLEILASALSDCPSKKVIWVDHHLWREEELSIARGLGFVEMLIDRSRTAAENMAALLGLDRDVAVKPLLEMSRDTDYGFFRHPLSEPLTDTIRYSLYAENDRGFLKRLVFKFSKGVFWDYEINGMWEAAVERKGKALEEIRAGYREAVIGGYRAIVVISDPVLSSRIALREIAGKGYDVAFVVYRNGAVIIVRGSGDVNCAEIAWRLGGGGHAHIAGAEIDPVFLSRGVDGVVEYLGSKI